ncbi:MAG TPA: hypothetical protein VGH43_00290 [Jatrophihabitans sp.]|jgi:hypothetical protein
MGAQDADPACDVDESPSERLDDLAAFLMHHAYDPGLSEADRLQTFAIVEAHQEGDDPASVELIMRHMALRFRDDPQYRREWEPRP